MDDLDAIMRVMGAAFDPAYGEAWNRRQVSDALAMPNTHHILAGADGGYDPPPQETAGFVLSRAAGHEEELLLIAVSPDARGRGVGSALLSRFIADAQERGASRLFLEMREGNEAERLYRNFGFTVIGRRRNYYRSGTSDPIDAITYGLERR